MQILETLMLARPWPMIPTLPNYTPALNAAWDDVLEGKASAAGALGDVERTMQALLDERLAGRQ